MKPNKVALYGIFDAFYSGLIKILPLTSQGQQAFLTDVGRPIGEANGGFKKAMTEAESASLKKPENKEEEKPIGRDYSSEQDPKGRLVL